MMMTLAALASSLTLTPLAVSAEETSQSQVIHVRTSQLQSEEGWDEIENRIRVATDRVCRPHGLRGLVAQRVRQACFDATYADGIAQLNRQFAAANSTSVAVVITAQ